MNQSTAAESIDKGLRFLKSRQLVHGGFSTSMSQSVNCANDDMINFELGEKKGNVVTDYHSVFPSMLIGLSLLPLSGSSVAKDILENIKRFVQSNQKWFGTWQHFTKQHQLYGVTPCDTDLTAMGSAFLKGIGATVPDNRGVILGNRNSKGLIYTWFSFRKDFSFKLGSCYGLLRELRHPIKSYYFWKYFECNRDDIDAVVNANVLSYVALDNDTSCILDWVNEVLQKDKEESCDKWYMRKSTVYYFFSRNYRPGVERFELMRKLIRAKVIDSFQENGSVDHHPLDTSLMISTLHNIDCSEDISPKSIEFLLSTQQKDGSWKKRIVYYGGPKKLAGWGSEELTTGYALEALYRYNASVRHD